MTVSLVDEMLNAPMVAAAPRKVRTRFFVVLAVALLAIVIVGFTPSFYLRTWWLSTHPTLHDSALPGYLTLHGILLTLWYVGFVVQTALVATNRVRIHRALGVASIGVAAGVLVTSALVVVRSVARSADGGVPASRLVPVVLGDFGALVLFAAFFTVGVAYRRRPEVHKRVMLLAAISLISPAIGRIPGALTLFPVFILLPVLVMLAALVGYDILQRRHVHPATVSAEAAYVFVVGSSVAFASTAWGIRLVEALR